MDPSLRLLRASRPFRWYWLGQSLSAAGSQVTALALPLVTAIALDGSPKDVGFVAAAAMLPYLLFSLPAGHFLESRPKRAVMIPADLVQALLLACIPLTWWLDILSVPLVAGIAFASGTAALCFGVVGFAYVPDLVATDQLPAANRAIQGSRTVADVAGPGVAGFLIGVLGAPLAMAVDAISYLASAAGIAAAPPRANTQDATADHSPERLSGAGGDKPTILTGLTVLFSNPHLRALTLHAALYNLANEAFTLNLVLWAVRHQGLSTTAYGIAMGAGGVGGVIGTMTALKLSERLGLGRAFIVSLVLSCGAPVLAVAWALDASVLAFVLGVVMLISGIGLGNANVYSLTLRQSSIPRDQLTRSAGAYTQVMYGSIPIGGVLAGVLGEALGARPAAIIGALLMCLSVTPMLPRSIRTLTLPST